MSPNKALQPAASRRSLWRFEKEMQRSRRLSSTVGALQAQATFTFSLFD
jgi:hypothetical protein